MKNTAKYTLITVLAILCFANANAQQKGKTTKPVAKAPAKAPAKKPAVDDKKVSNLAKSLGDTTKKGGATAAKPALPIPQNNSNLSEEIVVTTAYKPVLADAVKIRRNPNLEEQEPFKAPLNYKPLDKTLQQDTSIRQFSAMKLPRETPDELDNNYVRVGGGNLKTSFAEAFINNGYDPALQAGAYFKHLAQSGSIPQQTYNKEEAGIFAKSIGEVNSLSGRVNYQYMGTGFYAYDVLNPPTSTINYGTQHFNTLSGEVELTKNYKDIDDQFIYSVKLGGSMFSTADKLSENNIVLSGYLNQTVGSFYAGLSGSVDLTNINPNNSNSLSNNLARINPYIKFQGENYKIDAGINLVNDFGSTTNIFPAARLEWQIVPKYIRLFAEATGDVNKSTIRGFSEINPFLGPVYNIANSTDQLDLSAGLKGMIAPGFGFKASIFRNNVKNMPLFVSNFDFANNYNRFAVIYDNGNSRVSGFNGELDYKPSSDFDIFGRVEVRDYSLATEAKAWNLPSLKITSGTVIHLSEQLSVNGTLEFRGNTYDRLNNGTQIKLSSFADLDGGVEYKAGRKISIFVQVNNILGTTYQNWLYYPNYGFNIFGGVGYRF